MKRQRGRPQTLLARMSDETRDELCNAINYGSRAWRLIRLRRLLSENTGKQSEEYSKLWREFVQQLEAALMIGDDDFWNDLAKVIRGETQREFGAECTKKVLELWQRKPDATASEIFANEYLKKKWNKLPNGKPDFQGKVKVEDRPFANKQRALDAFNGIKKKIKKVMRTASAQFHLAGSAVQLTRSAKPLRHE